MVRFDEGPTTEATRTIEAPAAQIWPLVTDIALPAATSDELHATEWQGDVTEPAVGARFKGHNARGELQWTTESTIEVHEPPHRFAWVVGDPEDAIARWGFELVEVDEGATEVRQWTRLGPGRSGLTWAIRQHPDDEEAIIEGRLAQLQASMARNLELIAARVSGDDHGD